MRRLVDAFERRFDQTPRAIRHDVPVHRRPRHELQGRARRRRSRVHRDAVRGVGGGHPGRRGRGGGRRVRAPRQGRAHAARPRPRGQERCDVDQADVASLGASVLACRRRRTTPDRCLCRTSTRRFRPRARAPRSPTPSSSWRCTGARRRSPRASLTAFATPGGLRPYASLAGANETLAAAKHARVEGDHEAAVDAARALARVRGRRDVPPPVRPPSASVDDRVVFSGVDRRAPRRARDGRTRNEAPGLSGDTHARHRDRCGRLVRRVRRARLAARARDVLRVLHAPGSAWFARRASWPSPPPRRSDTRRREAARQRKPPSSSRPPPPRRCSRGRCAPRSTTRRAFSIGLFAATAARWSPSRRARRWRRRGRGDAVARAAAVSALAAAADPRRAGSRPFTLFSVDLEANTTLVVAGARAHGARGPAVALRARAPVRVRGRPRGRRRRRRGRRAPPRTSSWSRSSPCVVRRARGVGGGRSAGREGARSPRAARFRVGDRHGRDAASRCSRRRASPALHVGVPARRPPRTRSSPSRTSPCSTPRWASRRWRGSCSSDTSRSSPRRTRSRLAIPRRRARSRRRRAGGCSRRCRASCTRRRRQ